MQLPKGKVPNA